MIKETDYLKFIFTNIKLSSIIKSPNPILTITYIFLLIVINHDIFSLLNKTVIMKLLVIEWLVHQ